MVERLFLAVPRGCLRFVIVVFPDHTHLLFLLSVKGKSMCTKFWLPLVQALICELKTDMIVAADLDVKQKKQTNFLLGSNTSLISHLCLMKYPELDQSTSAVGRYLSCLFKF